MVVSRDGGEVCVFYFCPMRPGTLPQGALRLAGLGSGAAYRDEEDGRIYDGVLLETRGLPLPESGGDYQAVFRYLRRV
jgi:hypothetical protein